MGKAGPQDAASVPLIIATILRGDGITGVTRMSGRYADISMRAVPAVHLVTPFSWGGPLMYPVFGVRSSAWSATAVRQRRLVPALARGVPAQRTAPPPRRDRRLCRLRPGPPGRPGSDARAARAAPARCHGRPPSDLAGRRMGRQETDQARRGCLPGNPADRTRGDPAGRRPFVRVQLGAGGALGLAPGSRRRPLRHDRQLRGAAGHRACPGAAWRSGHDR